MAKTKSRKKRGKTATKIRANAKTIAIVVVLFVVFNGASFYLGMAAPRVVVSKTYWLLGIPDVSEVTDVMLTAPHSGVKITLDVTYVFEDWWLQVSDMNDNVVYNYTGYTVESHFTPFLPVPGGCKILIGAFGGFLLSELDVHLTVVASGPPFIF